jgi:hypothetical protein
MPWEALSKWALGALALILSWLGIDLYHRIRKLEEDRVTREDFDELRQSMMATFTNGHDRLEDKLDRIIERLMK